MSINNYFRRDFLKSVSLGAVSMAVPFKLPSQEKVQSSPEKTGEQSSSVFNVHYFGAKGDSKTPDSDAVQKALDTAGEVSGTVYFPAGRYLCHNLNVHQPVYVQ